MSQYVLRTRGWSLRWPARGLLVGSVFGLAIVAGAIAALGLGGGDVPLAPGDVVRALLGHGLPADEFVVRELRLPRLVTGLAVGAALALAGAVFQTLARNPLASPDLLGFTQGAATGALLVIVAGGGSAALAAGAIVGGVAAGVAIYVLAWRGGLHGFRLVLIGVGIAIMLTGLNGYLVTRANLVDAARAVLWLTGSLSGRGWEDAAAVLIALVVLGPVVVIGAGRGLRMLDLGDDAAHGLGVRVERLRLVVMGAVVVLAACAAAAAGPVSFVALTAPQVARRLTRVPGPNLLPSMLLGAVLLVTADLLAQRAIPDRELPVGVVTGLLGGGYLLWLLVRERRAGRL